MRLKKLRDLLRKSHIRRAVFGHAQRHVHVRQAVGPHQVEGAAVVDGLVDGNLHAVDRPLKQMGLPGNPFAGGRGVEEPHRVKQPPVIGGHGGRGQQQRNQRRDEQRAPQLSRRGGAPLALLPNDGFQGIGHGAVEYLRRIRKVLIQPVAKLTIVHCSPSSQSSRSRTLRRARAFIRRVLTVPCGTPSVSAISATENPSR